MKQASLGIFLGALVAFLALVVVPAAALSTPLAQLRGYEIGCIATAGGISLGKAGDLKAVSSMMVWVNSATPVYIGGTDVTSTKGMPICTNTALCPASSISIDAKGATCLSSSGTVTASVLVGTP